MNSQGFSRGISGSFTIDMDKIVIDYLRNKWKDSEESIRVEYSPNKDDGPYIFECKLRDITEYEEKDGNHVVTFNRCQFITPIPKEKKDQNE